MGIRDDKPDFDEPQPAGRQGQRPADAQAMLTSAERRRHVERQRTAPLVWRYRSQTAMTPSRRHVVRSLAPEPCAKALTRSSRVPCGSLPLSWGTVRFLAGHLGNPVPSAAVMGQIGNRFVAAVKRFAAANQIPILRLGTPDRSRWDDRKLDHVRPHLDQAERDGRFGVVAIVSGQEFAHVFSARNQATKPGAVWF